MTTHSTSRTGIAPAALALLLCAAAPAAIASPASPASPASFVAAPPPAKVALTHAKVVPVVGADLDDATVLIENGRIAEVGKDVAIPYDAVEVDCAGRTVMPGLIHAHAVDGMDVTNENLAVAPFLNVYDCISPADTFFEESLREGLTTVHVMFGGNTVIGGLSRALRPIGLSVEEMTVKPDVAMKISVTPRFGYDRMMQLAQLREAFAEYDDWLDRTAEKKYEDSLVDPADATKKGKVDVGPEEARKRGKPLLEDADYDDAHRNLMRLLRGDVMVWAYADAAMDVPPAIELAKSRGFFDRLVLVLGQDARRALPVLKQAGRPVVLPPNLMVREKDPKTGETREIFLPKAFAEAGVPFALIPYPDGSVAEHYLTFQAARCVRNGMTRAQALEAITLAPARLLGLESDVGSLEKGKVANVIVLSADPLASDCVLERSYIDGILAYDRARDFRLQEQLGAAYEPKRPAGKVAEPADKGKEGKTDAAAPAAAPPEGAKPEGAKPEGGK